MDDDRRDLANRLFAEATGMLEDASVLAAGGQSSRISPARLQAQGRRLQALLVDIAALVAAASVVLQRDGK